MGRAVVLLLIGCCSAALSLASTTTTPAPTLTTASNAVIDPQKEFHCSDKPTSNCGRRVLKCLFMKACNCTMTPADLVTQSCECCRECIQCLGSYLTECCACVGLCSLSPPSPSDEVDMETEETEEEDYEIEHFDVVKDALGLFEKTFAPMVDKRWQMYTFPVTDEPGPLGSRLDTEVARSLSASASSNCTVVYLDECTSRKNCASKCKVLMASSFRWFVNGCCECAGEHCLAGGSAKARCNHCRPEDFPQIDEEEAAEVMMGIEPSQLREL